jgi:hypothetical protein
MRVYKLNLSSTYRFKTVLYSEYKTDSYHKINSLHNGGFYYTSDSIVIDIDYNSFYSTDVIRHRDTILIGLRDDKINMILDENI